MNNQIKEEGLTDAYLLGKYDGIKQGRMDAITDAKTMINNAYEEMRRMARKYIDDGKINQSIADRMVALSDCYTMFIQVFDRILEKEQKQ